MTDLAESATGPTAEAKEKRPLRRDAERNRQLIMAAAREVFAERGLDVTLDDIARHAGVGVGTAYRRFANKDALIDELFEDQIDEFASYAEEALEVSDPWLAFTGFMEKVLAAQAKNRGLKQVLLSSPQGRERVCDARDRVAPLTSRLVERAKAAGAIRADFEETDLPMIHVMVGSVMDATRDVDPDAWKRYLKVLLSGIAADPAVCGALTGQAMTPAQVDQALHRPR
jgi:AcrR family transcriptional regulator